MLSILLLWRDQISYFENQARLWNEITIGPILDDRLKEKIPTQWPRGETLCTVAKTINCALDGRWWSWLKTLWYVTTQRQSAICQHVITISNIIQCLMNHFSGAGMFNGLWQNQSRMEDDNKDRTNWTHFSNCFALCWERQEMHCRQSSADTKSFRIHRHSMMFMAIGVWRIYIGSSVLYY